MQKKITIIGAGISGLSVARFLSVAANVQVLEKAEKIGGLVKCDDVAGNLFHKVGGHVFNSKNIAISSWFWSLFDKEKEFLQTKRNAKILFQDKMIGYPLENYLYNFDRNIVIAILADLLKIEKEGIKNPFSYGNFEEFLKGNFGETLYHLYFKPYNEKIWNTDLSEVAVEWLEGKLPMPDIKEILLKNVLKEEESEMVHATFFYPKSGGSQFIVNRLAEGLSIKENFTVNSVEKHHQQLQINDSLETDIIIYTGDVRRLSEIIKFSDSQLQNCLEDIKGLTSNGTSNLFCECDDNDLSWLYIPENFTKAHRIIYTGNFSPTNNSGSQRKTCVVEFSGKVTEQTMKEEIKKLPGNLLPLAYNYEPNSYVIQQKDTRQKINLLKEELKKYNFYLLGRFAEWEYYNMDKAIEAAKNVSQDILAKEHLVNYYG